MRRVWSWAVLVTVVVGVLASWAPAEAGGSTFGFNRRWYAPGQLVVGRTQFSDHVDEQGRVADGPYLAYLVRGDRFIEPPHVPPDAILLGRIRMRPLENGVWEASVRFVVPDVRPGRYTVSLCNDPCRSAFVGDLMGAWIFVADSAEQARMNTLEARIEERLGQQISDTTSGLQEQLDSLREAVETPRTSTGTELRLSKLDDQVKSLSSQVRYLRKRGDQQAPAWLWLTGWIVAAGIVVLWRRTTVRRRRESGTPTASEEVTWNAVAPPVALDDVDDRDVHGRTGELVSR